MLSGILNSWRFRRPQSYRCEIRVEVQNVGTKKKDVEVVVPVPMMTEYQVTTPVFRERTNVYPLSLAPGERESIVVPFEARVLPRRYEKAISPEITQANEFVISYLTYGNPIDGLYTAQEAREKRVVDCGGFDSLLQDELKKKGIESKIVAGFWAGYETNGMHAWLEIGDIPADPSMEYLRRKGRTRKSGKLGFVGSDRIAFSIGEPFLQNPFLVVEPLSSELSGSTTKLHYEKHFYCTRA